MWLQNLQKGQSRSDLQNSPCKVGVLVKVPGTSVDTADCKRTTRKSSLQLWMLETVGPHPSSWNECSRATMASPKALNIGIFWEMTAFFPVHPALYSFGCMCLLQVHKCYPSMAVWRLVLSVEWFAQFRAALPGPYLSCTNFAPFLPSSVSSVVDTKGAMWFRPHAAGFAWWYGQYLQPNQANLCSVCVTHCFHGMYVCTWSHVTNTRAQD